MNKINLIKVSIFSLIALMALSFTLFATSQVFAHAGDGENLQFEDISKEDFLNNAEAKYEYMEKVGGMPEDMTKAEYMEMQEDMYSMYDKYGSRFGMMGGGDDCPMHGGASTSGGSMFDGLRGLGGGMMGGGMMMN